MFHLPSQIQPAQNECIVFKVTNNLTQKCYKKNKEMQSIRG